VPEVTDIDVPVPVAVCMVALSKAPTPLIEIIPFNIPSNAPVTVAAEAVVVNEVGAPVLVLYQTCPRVTVPKFVGPAMEV
jgi:hypothetical protein